MYFYVDESGNTGNHLFDPAQPSLHYGVLGCRKNLDIVAAPMLQRLRAGLGVAHLHANELGVGRLIDVAREFTAFQKRHDVRFQFYSVTKTDHAVISFFDQVFDAGVNDAVPWDHYWTPLRYVLLMKVSVLFDDDLRRRAWAARLEQNPSRCHDKLIALCEALRQRLNRLPDARSREIIDGALRWTQSRPEAILYGASNSESALQISPNLIGFQQVLQGIALSSSGAGREVKSIIVDRQNEFNFAQEFVADIYRKMRAAALKGPFSQLAGMPKFDWRRLPDQPITFAASHDSAGLEMVDVYLWITKRHIEGRPLPDELRMLLHGQRHRGRMDEVSLRGVENRWSHLLHLPDPPVESAEEFAAYLAKAENSRLKALAAAGADGVGGGELNPSLGSS